MRNRLTDLRQDDILRSMITLYAGGGAGDFEIDQRGPERDASAFIANVRRVIEARGKRRASQLLATVPFGVQEAGNHFMDEFCVLFAAVPLHTYEQLREGKKNSDPGFP